MKSITKISRESEFYKVIKESFKDVIPGKDKYYNAGIVLSMIDKRLDIMDKVTNTDQYLAYSLDLFKHIIKNNLIVTDVWNKKYILYGELAKELKNNINDTKKSLKIINEMGKLLKTAYIPIQYYFTGYDLIGLDLSRPIEELTEVVKELKKSVNKKPKKNELLDFLLALKGSNKKDDDKKKSIPLNEKLIDFIFIFDCKVLEEKVKDIKNELHRYYNYGDLDLGLSFDTIEKHYAKINRILNEYFFKKG